MLLESNLEHTYRIPIKKPIVEKITVKNKIVDKTGDIIIIIYF